MNKDQEFQQSLKKTLDRQTVDSETRETLRAARARVLGESTTTRGSRWIPATVGACLALAIVALVLYRGVDDNQLPQMAADDLTVIAGEDELELFEELEFYLWFDEEAKV